MTHISASIGPILSILKLQFTFAIVFHGKLVENYWNYRVVTDRHTDRRRTGLCANSIIIPVPRSFLIFLKRFYCQSACAMPLHFFLSLQPFILILGLCFNLDINIICDTDITKNITTIFVYKSDVVCIENMKRYIRR